MRHSPESHVGRTPWSAADALVGLGGCRRPARPGGRARRGRPPHNGTFITFGGPAGPWGTPLKVTVTRWADHGPRMRGPHENTRTPVEAGHARPASGRAFHHPW